MPWVRFDDQYPINRKVSRLSDAAYRLASSAIFWCARNLTDGVVPEEDLDDVCARVRTPERFASEIVRRGLWHPLGESCDSEHCPANPHGPVDNPNNGVTKGWLIHDYFEYQPTKAKVLEERRVNAERQKKWREQQKQQRATDPKNRNAVSNAAHTASVTAPRPVPSRRDGDGSISGHLQAADARASQGREMLCGRYGITGDQADSAMDTIARNSAEPVKDWPRLLAHMADNGTLATIVGPLQNDEPPPAAPEPPRRSATGCAEHPDGAVEPEPPDGWGRCLLCNTRRRLAMKGQQP